MKTTIEAKCINRNGACGKVTDELNARPFRALPAPLTIFACACRAKRRLTARDALGGTLGDIDWDADAWHRTIRARQNGVQFNIERHTEFVSLTIIDKAENGSAAQHLPTDWLDKNRGEVVVAGSIANAAYAAARDGWTCASRWKTGWLTGFSILKWRKTGTPKLPLISPPIVISAMSAALLCRSG